MVSMIYMFVQVDHSVGELKYLDPVCDMLYHIKYMFTGDFIKSEVEAIIRGLRPTLQRRLRFITHLNLDSIEVSYLRRLHMMRLWSHEHMFVSV